MLDWSSNRNHRRSTSCGMHFLNGSFIYGSSRNQKVVSLSSCESELHSMVSCMSDAIFIRACCEFLLGEDVKQVQYLTVQVQGSWHVDKEQAASDICQGRVCGSKNVLKMDLQICVRCQLLRMCQTLQQRSLHAPGSSISCMKLDLYTSPHLRMLVRRSQQDTKPKLVDQRRSER